MTKIDDYTKYNCNTSPTNKNSNIKWINMQNTQKIIIDEQIFNYELETRGVYGIFIKDRSKDDSDPVCVYVGRSNNIYARMFSGSAAHFSMFKSKQYMNPRIQQAFEEPGEALIIKILQEVPLKFDSYERDMHELAFTEYKIIEEFQNKGQALYQLPDGRNLDEKIWTNKKIESDLIQQNISILE